MTAKPQSNNFFPADLYAGQDETLSGNTAMTKLTPHQEREQQAMTAEAQKQELSMHITALKALLSHGYIDQIGFSQASTLVRFLIKIWALLDEVKDPAIRETAESAIKFTFTSTTRWINAASAAGAEAIIKEVARPVYIEIEQRHPGFWDWVRGLFGGRSYDGY
jgi:hypothetical protein